MKLFLSLFLSVLFPLTSSAAQPTACWAKEVNPISKKPYTEQQWMADLSRWQQQEPENPSLWQLFLAHQTYQDELDVTKKIKGDKRKHCYMGCRIAQTTSYEVSFYIGWLKESEDLQDCDKKTNFEPLDQQSTADGAAVGADSPTPQSCRDYCSSYKPPQRIF